MIRYAVPYMAPGIKRGELRVSAENPDDALLKALEIHAGSTVLHRHGGGAKSARLSLHKREQKQIAYGEPRAISEAAA